MTMESQAPPTQPNRDNLALVRTRLANERTMLAYTRTAIMIAVAGATILKLYGDIFSAAVLGWAIVAVAAGVGFFGALRFRKLTESLQSPAE